MNTKTRRAWMRSTVATTACVVLALPAAAQAQSYDRHDPAHDVVLFTARETIQKAPANKTADITVTTFAHTRTQVTAQIKLRHYAGGMWVWTEYIKTPTHRFGIDGTKYPGGFDLFIYHPAQGDPLPCPGLSATIRPSRNTVRVTVPTSCLKTPHWVRVNISYAKMLKNGAMYVDDAMRKGIGRAETPTMTPRLYAH